jgi:DnaJ-class molecular chaperone
MRTCPECDGDLRDLGTVTYDIYHLYQCKSCKLCWPDNMLRDIARNKMPHQSLCKRCSGRGKIVETYDTGLSSGLFGNGSSEYSVEIQCPECGGSGYPSPTTPEAPK